MQPMDKDLLSVADARQCARRARAAATRLARMSQAEVDRCCHAAVEAGYAAAAGLAQLAVEETGIGRVDSKTIKNRFATRGLWQAVAGMRTCGVVSDDIERGILEVAVPFGVVAGIIPTTNPTSTALFKAICCLKSRNAMVVSPHPRATRCIREAVRVVHDAAVAAGAPEDWVVCMQHVALEGTQALMRDKDVDLILATGGSALVRQAYSSGKPAFGVGPGNVPVYVDRSANVAGAAEAIVRSQTFDNSTLCSSEQAIVCDAPVAQRLLEELRKRGVRLLNSDETHLLEALVVKDGGTNPAVVGLAAARIASMAGFEVAADTTVLLAPCNGVGPGHPLSYEKLAPILGWYTVEGHEAGCLLCIDILALGGRGHTLGLHCTDETVIRAFALEKPVNRIVLNAPTSLGAVGAATNLFPSMTLGCGSFGGNITSDNVGPQHLLNIKRLARANAAWRDGSLDGHFAEVVAGAVSAAHSPWDRPVAAQPKIAAPLLGDPTRRMPGEHFSAAELERVIKAALERRQATGGTPPQGNEGGGLSHSAER